MGTVNFSPGPWKYNAGAETVVAANGRIVVYELNTNEADGNLIAAALDMYVALSGFIRGRGCPIVTHHREDCEWCAAIRALAKADGKSL